MKTNTHNTTIITTNESIHLDYKTEDDDILTLVEIIKPYIKINNHNIIFNSKINRIDISFRHIYYSDLKNCPFTITCKKNAINLYFDYYDFTGINICDIFKSSIDMLFIKDIKNTKV